MYCLTQEGRGGGCWRWEGVQTGSKGWGVTASRAVWGLDKVREAGHPLNQSQGLLCDWVASSHVADPPGGGGEGEVREGEKKMEEGRGKEMKRRREREGGGGASPCLKVLLGR